MHVQVTQSTELNDAFQHSPNSPLSPENSQDLRIQSLNTRLDMKAMRSGNGQFIQQRGRNAGRINLQMEAQRLELITEHAQEGQVTDRPVIEGPVHQAHFRNTAGGYQPQVPAHTIRGKITDRDAGTRTKRALIGASARRFQQDKRLLKGLQMGRIGRRNIIQPRHHFRHAVIHVTAVNHPTEPRDRCPGGRTPDSGQPCGQRYFAFPANHGINKRELKHKLPIIAQKFRAAGHNATPRRQDLETGNQREQKRSIEQVKSRGQNSRLKPREAHQDHRQRIVPGHCHFMPAPFPRRAG